MPVVSVTRLRLRSIRFLPLFALYTSRSLRQIRRAPGFLLGELFPDSRQTYWTLTTWESESAMRSYIRSGAHMKAMPKLMYWCDEASVVHWTQAEATLPPWRLADSRMRTEGRPSKVIRPSPEHAGLCFAEPRNGSGFPIQPRS